MIDFLVGIGLFTALCALVWFAVKLDEKFDEGGHS